MANKGYETHRFSDPCTLRITRATGVGRERANGIPVAMPFSHYHARNRVSPEVVAADALTSTICLPIRTPTGAPPTFHAVNIEGPPSRDVHLEYIAP